MHLLFRPSATPVEDRTGLAFSSRIDGPILQAFCREIEEALKTPMSLIEPDGEPSHVVHDRIMARQQALVHRTILTLADSLEDVRMRTFVGKRICELADRIRAGDPVLYRMIQENPHLPMVLEEFEARLRRFEAGS